MLNVVLVGIIAGTLLVTGVLAHYITLYYIMIDQIRFSTETTVTGTKGTGTKYVFPALVELEAFVGALVEHDALVDSF